MRVAVDTSVLLYLIYPDASSPIDPSTGLPVTHCQQRIQGLLDSFEDAGDVEVIVPTPVLSELLIRVEEDHQSVISSLEGSTAVRIQEFDRKAAIENAMLRREAMKNGKKSRKKANAAQADTGNSKKEVSFDLQVISIAKAMQVATLYSDDGEMRKLAQAAGIDVLGVADLAVPTHLLQVALPLPAGDGQGGT